MPCSERNKWLYRQIQLRAESAANRGWNDSYCFGRNPQDFGNVGAIHVGRLGARLNFNTIPNAPRKPRLRLNISMLDESGLVLVLHHDIGFGQSAFNVAPHHASPGEHVAFAVWMNQLCIGSERSFHGAERIQWFPADGKVCEVEILDGHWIAGHHRNCLTAKPSFIPREHRLIRESGNHAIAILSRHIFRGENCNNTGMRFDEGFEVAKREARTMIRAADDTHCERSVRNFVGAVHICAVDLPLSVQTNQPGADRTAGLRKNFQGLDCQHRARHG